MDLMFENETFAIRGAIYEVNGEKRLKINDSVNLVWFVV